MDNLAKNSGSSNSTKTANNLLNYWTADHYFREFEVKTKADVYKKNLLKNGVPVMEGRYRRCASQQGYCLYYLLKLGFENQGIHKLAERLLHWQWPDGGWNCDKDPKASTSTLIHTAIALKGLVSCHIAIDVQMYYISNKTYDTIYFYTFRI